MYKDKDNTHLVIEGANEKNIIKGFGEFDLKNTFECGQCFRWETQADGSYRGVAGGVDAVVSKIGDEIHIKGPSLEQVKSFWIDYLDLSRDYKKLCNKLSALDNKMSQAIDFSRGLRLLRQPFFEVLISFIISQNNNVPRISGIIDRICRECGEKLSDERFAFPEPEQLIKLKEADYSRLGAGYRSIYLEKIVKLYDEGHIDSEHLATIDFHQARNALIDLPGIGPKVADCVLLYSGLHQEAFPSDVWVKRVMMELYELKNANEIFNFTQGYFGKDAGYAQQFLFHYARTLKMGV